MDNEFHKNLFQYTLLLIGVLLLIVSIVDTIKDKHKNKKRGAKSKIIFVFFPPILLLVLSAFVYWSTETVLKFKEPISFIIGLAMTSALGLSSILQRFLDFSVKDLGLDHYQHGFITEEQLDELIFIKEGGIFIGLLERPLFFIILWYGNPVYIGAILTFKLAAKWEAWKNIVKVPEQKPDEFINDFSYFIFKRKLGSKHLTQFLIGTFSNILFALMGYGFYNWCLKVFHP